MSLTRTGGAQLEKHFAEVTLERVSGELRVTEAQAIVDYVTSIEPAKPIVVGEVLEELRAMVEGEIEAKGAFVIATEVGMFCGVRRG